MKHKLTDNQLIAILWISWAVISVAIVVGDVIKTWLTH